MRPVEGGPAVGFRFRKSFKIVPGVRMTVSKSGVGYSVGGKGVRLTKRADGRVQRTVSLPGTGFGYTSISGSRSKAERGDLSRRPRSDLSARVAEMEMTKNARREATRQLRASMPMPRRMKTERVLLLIGVVLLIVG